MKKIISILLAAMLIISMFPAITVSAASQNYVKVTSAPTDWSGQYLIVYEDGNVAFNGNLTTMDAVSNTVGVKIADNKITLNDTYSFTIEKSGSNYVVKSASGYYIGQTSNANGLKSNTSTTYANTISMNADGTVNFVSGGAYLRYNASSGQTRFRYFKSSTYTGQKAICLYKLEETGTAPDCEHANTTTTTVDATCTVAGSTTVTCDDCGHEVSSVEIPALGHPNMVTNDDAVEATCTAVGKTASKYCETCDTTFPGTEIPMAAHNYGSGNACVDCGAAKPAGYAPVTDINEVKAGGKFVVVAYTGTEYYAMPLNTTGKLDGVAVTVDGNGYVVAEEGTPIWTVTSCGDGVAFYHAAEEKYLGYNSSTNFAIAEEPYEWSVTASGEGFKFTSSKSTNRGIIFQITDGSATQNRFGAYATSNTNGYQQILMLYKVAAEETKTVVAEGGAVYETVEEALEKGATKLQYSNGDAMDFQVDVTVDGTTTTYVSLKGENEEFYTYYKLDLKLTGISLRSSAAGIYYRAQVTCDDTLAQAVTSYGIVLNTKEIQGNDLNAEGNVYTTIAGPVPVGKDILSGSVFNIFKDDDTVSADVNRTRGAMDIYATVYLNINGNIVVATEKVAWSLQDVLVAIDGKLSPEASNKLDLSEAQKSDLCAFYQKWAEKEVIGADITGWELANIAALCTG